MSAPPTQPFRVLLSAYVDLNVIDGSAFFVAGVASLLTSAPGTEVHVVAATPIRRPVVVEEMLVNDRVTLTDPFRDRTLAAVVPEMDGASRMDETMLARVLAHYEASGHHDVVVVRSTEVGHALSQLRPDLGPRLCVYVTGVVADDQDVDPTVLPPAPGARGRWRDPPLPDPRDARPPPRPAASRGRREPRGGAHPGGPLCPGRRPAAGRRSAGPRLHGEVRPRVAHRRDAGGGQGGGRGRRGPASARGRRPLQAAAGLADLPRRGPPPARVPPRHHVDGGHHP